MRVINKLFVISSLFAVAVACSDESSGLGNDDGDLGDDPTTTELVPSFEVTAYDGTKLKIEDDANNQINQDEELTFTDTSTGSPTEVRWALYDSDGSLYKTVTAVSGKGTYTFTEEGTYDIKMFAQRDDLTESITYDNFIVVEKSANDNTAALPDDSGKEWDIFPIDYVEVAEGKAWVLLDVSDEFNDSFAATTETVDMNGKWTNHYRNGGWLGGPPTYWQRDRVCIEDGKMKVFADRPENPVQLDLGDGTYMDATYTACATSTERVKYPVYVETYVKISNSTLASAVWLLSEDDTQEIDICEAYGSDRPEMESSYFGRYRLHLSHHVFIRDPFEDYQPSDAGSFYKDDLGTIWYEDYHRIGVFWEDPTHLYYYVDGELVRSVNNDGDTNMIDPYNYTAGENLSKEMDIIVNLGDQTWRASQGLSPTDDELSNVDEVTMNVEWIRAYQLVDL